MLSSATYPSIESLSIFAAAMLERSRQEDAAAWIAQGGISIILTPIAESIVSAEVVILVVRKAITYILTKNENDFSDP